MADQAEGQQEDQISEQTEQPFDEELPRQELRRSTRERKPPVRFGDPIVQTSPSVQSLSRHKPKLTTKAQVQRRVEACIDKIERNAGKATYLIANSGSKSLLIACSERMVAAWDELNNTYASDTEGQPDPEETGLVDEFLLDLEAKVEGYQDRIHQHLDERFEAEETFRTPSAASTPLRPRCTNTEDRTTERHPAERPRDAQRQDSAPPRENPSMQQTRGLMDCRIPPPTPGAQRQNTALPREDPPMQPFLVENRQMPDTNEHGSGALRQNTTSESLSDSSVNAALVNVLEKLALQAELPATTAMAFDGNPANYMAFINSFDERIGNRSVSEIGKLAQLVQATVGKARETVELFQGQDNGYALARKALVERFGQPFQILDACFRKLHKWRQQDNKDPEKFMKFSDQLWADYKMMCNLDLLHEVDNQTHLKKIFDRLPPKSQGRWVEKVNELQDRGARPTYKIIVEFVKQQARRASHPVYRTQQVPNSGIPPPHSMGTRPRPPLFADQRPLTMTAVADFHPSTKWASDTADFHPSTHWENRYSFPQYSVNSALSQPPTFPSREAPRRPPPRRTSPDDSMCKFCGRGHHIVHCPVFALKPVPEDARTRPENTNLGVVVEELHPPHNYHAFEPTDARAAESDVQAQPRQELSATLNSTSVKTHVFLRVVPVRIAVNKKALTTYALLDTGSTCSMMSRVLADKFGVKGEPRQINLSTVMQRQQVSMEFVDTTVAPAAGTEPVIQIRNTHIVPQLTIDNKFKQDEVDVTTWEHLKKIPLQQIPVDVDKVTVLLGEDLPRAHVVLDAVYGEDIDNQPYAIRTPFGWCLAGPTTSPERKTDLHGNHADEHSSLAVIDPAAVQAIRDLEKAVDRMWSEERHGFTSEAKAMSVDDKKALGVLDARVKLRQDGHYSAPLLWKSLDTRLPDNFNVAKACLDQLGRKFKARPEFRKMYIETVEDYIRKGYARELTDAEFANPSGCVWYLPHHGVENVHKPGKVRVVFNAASRYRGASLNDHLLSGPDINNNMIGTLLRFRGGPVAISADVAEMFHQVWVDEEHRDALRFLWWPNGDSSQPPKIQRMERHIFGAADSPCVCVYALQRTAKDNRDRFSKEAVDAVLRSMYVDDLLYAAHTVDQAVRLANELREMLLLGGFKLTKFMSTSPEVIASLPDDCVQPGSKDISFGDLPTQRALGVKWDVSSDTFGVRVDILDRPSTRRGCLSFICSITDPFGLVAPVTMVGKRIVQEACPRQLEWDTPLPYDIMIAWKRWKESLSCLTNLRLQRCLFGFEHPEKTTVVELHHFCDASEQGYGVVSYLRVQTHDGTVHCSFILSKSRTPPLRFLSIPRLELQATVVAARVAKFLCDQLDMQPEDNIIWTDSVIALQYIRNRSKRLKTYAANRVQEIQDIIAPSQVRHCPTRLNIADVASRGLLGDKLEKHPAWLKGPEFLRYSKDLWPSDPTLAEITVDDPEVKTSERTLLSADSTPTPADRLVYHYSSWQRLLYAVSFFHKFMRHLITKAKGCRSTTSPVVVRDLRIAELSVVRYVQRLELSDVIGTLSSDKKISKSCPLLKLCPILVDGVLRVGGRLGEAPLKFTERHPAILPKKHHISTLVIRDVHASLAHAGPQHTLAALRCKYWVIGAKSTIKGLVKDCFTCRRLHSRLLTQIMAELPKERLTAFQPPFSVTGCDALGPLLVKRGRKPIKTYVILFTCFSIRAVHLEVIPSLTTESFLMALFRFIARRGPVKQIWCDNGTNFVGGARELRTCASLDLKQVNTALTNKGIEWHFQTPGSPHMNGVWERLVKSVKTAMKAIFGNALVSDEVFHTTVVQIESVLNGRPITPATDDIDDLNALTPNHFLLGSVSPPIESSEQFNESYRRQWQYSQHLVSQAWRRWIREYLPTLQLRSKWHTRQRNVQPGDLVLISDPNIRRSQWPLARVISIQEGRDGMVRSVTVKTANGTYTRAIHKLCLLEGAPAPVPTPTRRSGRIAGESRNHFQLSATHRPSD